MNWIRIRILGRGAFATVWLARSLHSNIEFAVKSVDLANSEFLQKEREILSMLNCPQIVKYMGHGITNENGKVLCNLYLEYARGGSLVDFMQNRGGSLDEKMIRICTRAIVEALAYIHAMGIVHCDIKGKNILITNGGPKLADFGCARRVDSDLTIHGNRRFNAPEVTWGEYGFPADIWSLGCTVIEMATGLDPWKGVSNSILNPFRLGFMNNNNVPQIPPHLSPEGQDFLRKCLRRNHLERCSASQLLHHPFLHIAPNIVNFVLPTPLFVTPNHGMFFM